MQNRGRRLAILTAVIGYTRITAAQRRDLRWPWLLVRKQGFYHGTLESLRVPSQLGVCGGVHDRGPFSIRSALLAVDSHRERISLDDYWRFTKGDPPDLAKYLTYPRSRRGSTSPATGIAAWILPTGNALNDADCQFNRPHSPCRGLNTTTPTPELPPNSTTPAPGPRSHRNGLEMAEGKWLRVSADLGSHRFS